jgi:hypothetical protein
MADDSFNSMDNQFLSLSSNEARCRLNCWYRWCFRQFQWSSTIMMKVWLGCFDDLFSNWNVSHGWHLFICSLRLLLCSSYVLPTLPYLQQRGTLATWCYLFCSACLIISKIYPVLVVSNSEPSLASDCLWSKWTTMLQLFCEVSQL